MSAARKEQMLQAAYEIVGKEGIEGLHARSVAAAVGVNHAAVHYYYKKRHNLVAALVEYAFSRFAQDRAKFMDGARSSTDRLEGHLAQAEAYCRPTSRFVKNWCSFFVFAIQDPLVAQKMAGQIREWTAGVAADLTSPGVDRSSPFADAELLTATLFGLIFTSHADPDFDASEKLDVIAESLRG